MTQLINMPKKNVPPSAALFDTIITNKLGSVINSDRTLYPVGDHELISVMGNLNKPKLHTTIKTNSQKETKFSRNTM